MKPAQTILVVEDEDITATMLRFLLERQGYGVIHLSDGLQACAHIDQSPPASLVLLDVMLPYQSGLKVLGHLRQDARWRQIPVLMLTADSSEHGIQQALDAGANDYLVKPFNPRELTARLQRFMNPAA